LRAARAVGNGERQIWVEARVLDKLMALRGPGKSYSEVILELVELESQPSRRKG
jgi:hypothetical protein